MIDVSPKNITLRYARAQGRLYASPETIQRVKNGQVPKGDVLQVARAAGISAAKRTAEWLVFCHPIPLDWVEVSVEPEAESLLVQAEVKAIWRTGVEMEALTAASAALLNAYDMLKPIDQQLRIGEIELVEKRGGKSDFAQRPDRPIRAGVLVVSTSTAQGTRTDRSGPVVRQFLEDRGVQVVQQAVVPDQTEAIVQHLEDWADRQKLDLIFTSGGTGLGPYDLTPEATRQVIDREVPGIAEAIRRYGKERTPYAMLSREVAGLRGQCLIINLPGSSKGALESLQALFPGLLHAFHVMAGGGH
ncbi:MAG: bifunctional molybdenum cofactor biosynthesis protein MoaC/MoaB [Calditrichaeota bacterium]|nr:MAG: bifunctional molybdenum cofactor biosynthesis protein MoaC/MoaB [Calditrichota bacterium]